MGIRYSYGLIRKLQESLQQPLPGWQAQRRMATETHHAARLRVPTSAQQAGVLILLYPGKDQCLYFPLIKRPTYDGAHSGQIAFPGGKAELQDRSIVETALRETREEIGIDVPQSQVVGQLSDLYIPVSKIVVSPVIAFTEEPPVYETDPYEVAATLDVPAHDFLESDNQSVKTIKVRDFVLDAPTYQIQGQTIWGATAMMLAEFFAVLEEIA